MTKDEAIKAFRAQTPVVLIHQLGVCTSQDVFYNRICELHYRITNSGEQLFYLTVTDGKGEYHGGPEYYRPATQKEITAMREKEERDEGT